MPTADTLVPAAEAVVCALACAIRISVQHIFMSLQVLMLLSCVSSALLVTLLFFHCHGTPISGPACNFGPAACVCVCTPVSLQLTPRTLPWCGADANLHVPPAQSSTAFEWLWLQRPCLLMHCALP